MNKYIFLDFNGTVLDDIELCINLLNEMLSEKEGKTVTVEEYKNIFCFPIINYYKAAGFTFDGYTFEELADVFIVDYARRSLTETKIFDDLEMFVKIVNEIGYKVVICSASLKPMLINQLKHAGIYELFEDVIGLDNHFAVSKLELAKEYVKNMNVDLEQSYFIGDTTHDAEVGVACGLIPILVDRGHQNEEVLKQAKSLILHSLLEVATYLKNQQL